MSTEQYGPQLTAFKLYKKTSKRTGNEYLYGRWGALKVIILRSSETTDDGGEIFNVVLQQADDKPRQQRDSKPSRTERSRVNEPLGGYSSRSEPNDAIPF